MIARARHARRAARDARIAARRRAGGLAVDSALNTLSRLGKLHPAARRLHRGVEIIRDVPYRDPDGRGSRDHLLDIYRPPPGTPSRSTLIYVHGGGFRILSKDTHWMMGLGFAQRGHTVFSINYRLAPDHPYPAAVEDTFAAVEWIADHARDYDADPDRLVLAGESAGANLICNVIIASCYPRTEPRARALYARNLPIIAALPACGLLQVSDPARFRRRRPSLPQWLDDRIIEVSEAYLDGASGGFADPLLVFEREAPDRPLPPMCAVVGTRDPILDDTRRLGAAVEGHGGRCDVRIHRGGVHAFQAVFWRGPGRAAWDDQHAFLDEHVP